MQKRLNMRQRILVAATLFGMFFGAGNLIFPVHLGQLAGRNAIPAMIGFIITAVGIPILGVAAIGNTHSDGLQALATKVGKRYGYFFTCLLYLTIGPFFAIPRCATTSFTTGIRPMLGENASEALVLLLFSLIFFGLVLFFSLRPGKITVWIGKIINPLFLIFFAILVVAALCNPAREDAINQAIADGYNTIVMAGFLFGPACAASAAQHPDVNFLALDVSAFDLGVDPIPSNVSLIVYKEEQAGYLAGYAAVMAGYTELGYCGGMAVPAVVRYGYGFVQGADAAAEELGVDVNLKYWYSGVFAPNDEIVSKMDTWYVEGTEVVFACGGAIYQSVVSAAESNEALVIGVDVDQSNISDTIITSAMKALSNSVILALTSCGTNGWAWPEAYAGTCQSLGAAEDCVGLPMETSKLGDFDQAAYDALFAAIVDGTVVIDDTSDAEVHPETAKVVVDWQ